MFFLRGFSLLPRYFWSQLVSNVTDALRQYLQAFLQTDLIDDQRGHQLDDFIFSP